jgi:hypothetical protein
MGAQSTIIKWDALRSLSSASVTGTYGKVGTAFTFPPRLVKIINNSTQDVTVSVDGINDHDYVPAGGFTLYDIGTNRGNSASESNIQQGTQIFVKGTAGTGNVYVVTLYAYSPTNTIPGE